MAQPDLKFKIDDEVKRLVGKHVVILLETKDKKLIQMEAKHETINKIHDKIRDQMITW